MNLLFRTLLVSVMKRVDHALADAHSNAVAVVLAESRCFRDAQTHLLGEIDTLDLRLQRNFKMLGVRRHFFAMQLPRNLQSGRTMVNIAVETESMEPQGANPHCQDAEVIQNCV